MDKQPSTRMYLILTVIIFLLNNLMLFHFFRSAPDYSIIARNGAGLAIGQIKTSVDDTRILSKVKNTDGLYDRGSGSQKSEIENIKASAEVSSAVKQYMDSDEFFELFDVFRVQQQEKRRQYQEQIAPLSAIELVDIFTLSTDPQEQALLIEALGQKDLTEIDISRLRDLYNSSDIKDDGVKSKLIIAMLDKKDEFALSLAKDFVQQSQRNTSGQVWGRLLDLDRDFVIKSAIEMSVDQISQSDLLWSGFFQDTEAKVEFYNGQLDNILAAADERVFKSFQPFLIEMELSRLQQNSLAELLQSDVISERRFAIGFVMNIDDINIVKQGYRALTSVDDRQRFLIGALSNTKSQEILAWAIDTTESSDVERIRQLGEGWQAPSL